VSKPLELYLDFFLDVDLYHGPEHSTESRFLSSIAHHSTLVVDPVPPTVASISAASIVIVVWRSHIIDPPLVHIAVPVSTIADLFILLFFVVFLLLVLLLVVLVFGFAFVSTTTSYSSPRLPTSSSGPAIHFADLVGGLGCSRRRSSSYPTCPQAAGRALRYSSRGGTLRHFAR